MNISFPTTENIHQSLDGTGQPLRRLYWTNWTGWTAAEAAWMGWTILAVLSSMSNFVQHVQGVQEGLLILEMGDLLFEGGDLLLEGGDFLLLTGDGLLLGFALAQTGGCHALSDASLGGKFFVETVDKLL